MKMCSWRKEGKGEVLLARLRWGGRGWGGAVGVRLTGVLLPEWLWVEGLMVAGCGLRQRGRQGQLPEWLCRVPQWWFLCDLINWRSSCRWCTICWPCRHRCLNPQPATIKPSTLNPQPPTRNPAAIVASTRNPQPLNPQPSTLNPAAIVAVCVCASS